MTIPATMHGLVLKEDGFSGTSEGPSIEVLDPYVGFSELPVPQPGDGQVLIRVTMASINPSDLHYIKGEYGVARRKGVPAGFEGVGEVVKAGEGGTDLVGKRVGFFASASGVWADYAIADISACVPVIDQVRDEDAAALLVNPMTAIAMYEEARAGGNSAFIMTAAASQLCKLIAGLAEEDNMPVISIVRRDEHVAYLSKFSCVHALNSEGQEFDDEMKRLIAELKPRVMLDAVADQVSSDLFSAMPARARWIVYGKLSSENPVLNQMGQFIFMDKKVEGFWLSKWMGEQTGEVLTSAGMKVQQMFASGKWQTDIAAKIPLSEAHEKLPAALAGANHGKVFLVPG